MCRVNLSSTDLTLQLVQIGRFLTRSSLCRNLKFCQHCMQGQNFDLGWDRRWAWNQDCHSMSQHVTTAKDNWLINVNHRIRKWPAFANSSSLRKHCVNTFWNFQSLQEIHCWISWIMLNLSPLRRSKLCQGAISESQDWHAKPGHFNWVLTIVTTCNYCIW